MVPAEVVVTKVTVFGMWCARFAYIYIVSVIRDTAFLRHVSVSRMLSIV